MATFQVKTLQETKELARRLGRALQPGAVVAFKGGLGAGKTTFTGGLAEGLGIKDRVTSPTFALVVEYSMGERKLVHFDMYRVLDLDSLESTGYYDYLDGENILAIEWSENIWSELPEDKITVLLERDPALPEGRSITIEGVDLSEDFSH